MSDFKCSKVTSGNYSSPGNIYYGNYYPTEREWEANISQTIIHYGGCAQEIALRNKQYSR